MLQPSGLYGHVQRNNACSLIMFAGFLLACQVIGLAILFLPLMVYDYTLTIIYDPWRYLELFAFPIFLISALIFVLRYWLHLRTVQNTTQFKFVTKPDEPRLHRLVEIQAIGAGIDPPRIAIIEQKARNAFACGRDQSTAIIVVTRGLINALNDDELEAVIAHEIVHIVRGDIRMMAVANVMLSTLFLLKRFNPLKIRGAKQVILAVLFPPLLVLFLTGGLLSSVAMTLGMLSRLLIASSRELIADAEAVRMTKNPSALASALRTIEGKSTIEGLHEEIEAMMIDGPVDGAYASHPTIDERVEALNDHIGIMLHGAGFHKDTRYGISVRQAAPTATTQAMAAGAQPHTALRKRKAALIDRVNKGSKENAFGLTPGIRTALIVAFGGLFIFQHLMYQSASQAMSDLRTVEGPTEVSVEQTLKNQAKQLAKVSAAQARCFGTEPYSIGDRGLHDFYAPDQSLVRAYTSGDRIASGVAIEKYLGLRLRSHKAIQSAGRDQLNNALHDYIETRQTLLFVMHRFYGDKGLDFMTQTYLSNQDESILNLIKRRLDNGSLTTKDASQRAEFELLINNPADFIPCYARAKWDA